MEGCVEPQHSRVYRTVTKSLWLSRAWIKLALAWALGLERFLALAELVRRTKKHKEDEG